MLLRGSYGIIAGQFPQSAEAGRSPISSHDDGGLPAPYPRAIRAQGSNNFRRKNFSADMATIDDRSHVYARSRLDTLLSVCVCVVVTSRQPLSGWCAR
jgi:hypothetical protein